MNNKFYFTIPEVNQSIDLPLEIKWDFEGRTDSIEIYERQVLEEVIGLPTDYEILRFSHKEDILNGRTDINYEFNFYNANPANVTTSLTSDWTNSYLAEGFNAKEVYYFTKPFTKSFFKLDFYDTSDLKTQINYFSIIIPVQQGGLENNISISTLAPLNNVSIKKPLIKLDFVGDKEGFFIYWLRKTNFLNIKTFYMSAKFFDAKIGVFVKMMNVPQATLPNKFLFDGSKYFFYKVTLDYDNKTYQVFDTPINPNNRIGITTPIKWYEYVNPPQ